MQTRGKFITLEGTEGVGKSTNLTFVKEYLAKHDIFPLFTREPGGTPLAEQIRGLLLENRDEEVDETAELLLMFAARSQHLQKVILPAIERGQWVVCDRFTDATYAYQGGGRGLNSRLIEELEQTIQGDIRPDLTLLLDIDVEIGLERAGRRAELDRFENEQIEFFQRVRQAYLTRVKQNPNRYAVIDASQPLLGVQNDIKEVLDYNMNSLS